MVYLITDLKGVEYLMETNFVVRNLRIATAEARRQQIITIFNEVVRCEPLTPIENLKARVKMVTEKIVASA